MPHRVRRPCDTALPNTNGPLSNRMPSEAISSANREVLGLVHKGTGENRQTINTTRGPYATFTAAEKVVIAKRAAEFGVTNTLRYYQEKFADHPLKESTAILPGPAPNSSYSFRENNFCEIEFCH